MLEKIRIVLVRPSHPGNIGACARAMKNMGFYDLALVNPKTYPSDEAYTLAAGASDILDNASVYDDLSTAIADCNFVIGTTARMRALSCSAVSIYDLKNTIMPKINSNAKTAILFGNERTGLTNQELSYCQKMLYIPTNPEYESLNLASALQIVCYELSKLIGIQNNFRDKKIELANTQSREHFFQHLEKVLLKINFINNTTMDSIMLKLRSLYSKADLTVDEIKILRGILARQELMVNKFPIYLDYAATTPVDPKVITELNRFLGLDGHFGNPASGTHIYGRVAQEAVLDARINVAKLINTQASEIIFTSGATEANNLAIKGVAEFYQNRGKHIITVASEHKAVLDPCEYLQQKGYTVTYLKPQQNGLIDLDELSKSITDDTLLISVMHVNNEIGVIQDIAKIGEIARKHNIFFHVDAAQSAGKIPIDVEAMNIDLLSISGHKMYSPKGIGALYVRKIPRVKLVPQMHGGGQEFGLRSGTLATHQIVALGKAAQIACLNQEEEFIRIQKLHNRFLSKMDESGAKYIIFGDREHKVPHILNISFDGVDGKEFIANMQRYVAISQGSACNVHNLESSHVLSSLGVFKGLADKALRFSFGRFTTEKDIELILEKMLDIYFF